MPLVVSGIWSVRTEVKINFIPDFKNNFNIVLCETRPQRSEVNTFRIGSVDLSAIFRAVQFVIK